MSISNYTNKSKKLIIYTAVPFFDTWPKKFELNTFKNYGLDVELWSTAEIFYNSENIKKASSGSSEYLYKDLDVIKIQNFIDLEKKVASLESNAIVCIMTLGAINNNTLNNSDLDIFNKYKIKYVIHHLIPYPVVPNLWFKLKFHLRLLQKRFNNAKKKPSLIIGTGILGRNQAFKIYKNNFIYKSVPSFNILWSKENPIINDKYIVYVDEAVNLSPDAALFGHDNPTHDIKGFYNRINDVFEKIENWTNSKIIIAASGKYQYEINPFKNRQIIYKKTSNLIQHSMLVLGHCSSALEQAIVDNKPLILFKDIGRDKLKNKIIHNFALVFKKNSIWTTQLTKNNFEKNIHINRKHNKEIINQYLKEDSVTGTFVENFTSAFHKI